jgi:multisubunit Na+/H+ antiporter MnhB subunit
MDIIIIEWLLLILMAIGAIVAIEVRDLLSSVIAAGIVGFSLTVVYLMLQAPDIAITQAVVETITLVMLVAVIAKTTRKGTPTPWASVAVISSLAFLLVLLFTFEFGMFALPEFGSMISRDVSEYYISHGVADTGAINLVAAVILDYRAYDTLGEAIVLFASALGVAAVLRSKVKKGGEE